MRDIETAIARRPVLVPPRFVHVRQIEIAEVRANQNACEGLSKKVERERIASLRRLGRIIRLHPEQVGEAFRAAD